MFLRSIVILDIKYEENTFEKLNTTLFWLHYDIQRQNVVFDFEQLRHRQIKRRQIKATRHSPILTWQQEEPNMMFNECCRKATCYSKYDS